PVRYQAQRALVPEHAAQRSRNANRPGAVRAVRDGPDTGRNRGGRATARAAGRPLQAPRIARRWTEQIVAGVLVPKVRGIRLAENDSACRARPTRNWTIKIRHVVIEVLRAGGGAEARRGLEIFDGDG